MKRTDALEAAPLLQRVLVYLNKIIPPVGRPGSDARTAIGDLYVNVYALLISDTLGAPLDDVFDLVQQAGATYGAFGAVRDQIELEAPTTLGGNLAKDLAIDWCLTMQGVCIANMTFESRGQVDQIIATLQQPFYDADEIAADAMDPMTFQNLIALHACITNHLVRTALPLPRMIGYQFADILPTLVIAYRLYGDASRCDEVRAENEIVHPAFCPTTGQALSA
ncbi:MAG TPA: hypothetical protein VKB78_14075 [Pirellulales bacterium]|nr:hypothetical protein [Pirellulales bacterium]